MDVLPTVRFELRHGTARPAQYDMTDAGFLIGSVPGCDLRLPGAALPSVFCLIIRQAGQVIIRKLAPTQPVLVNGRSVSVAPLAAGDRVSLGGVELHVHIEGLAKGVPATPPGSAAAAAAPYVWLAGQHQVQQRRSAERLAEVAVREKQLADARLALDQAQAQHQADLVRLDRLAAQLDQRQQQFTHQVEDLDRRSARLDQDVQELEAQARQLDDAQAQTVAEAERLAKQSALLDQRGAESAERTTAVESQQALLATLRSRLERMREEIRQESQLLAQERSRQQTAEVELQQQLQEVQQLRGDLEDERRVLEEERRQFEERRGAMEKAVAEMRQLQEGLTAQETELQRRLAECATRSAEQAEQTGLVQARMAEVAELRQRLDADRQALRDREANLVRAEQAREALQEQLRRRSEELAVRQKELSEQARQREQAADALQQQLASLDAHRTEVEQLRQHATEEQSLRLQALNARAAELDAWDQKVEEQERKLQELGRSVAAERKALSEDHAHLTTTQQTAAKQAQQLKLELAGHREALQELEKRLPEREQQARAASERLDEARQRLRAHLAELHAYARQGHEALESLRAQLLAQAEDLRQQLLTLHRAREEHRLAVAGFRQHIIDWHGQIAEMKRALAHDETRLERRQAEVDEQARAVDANAVRLARQAEELDSQQRQVQERQSEMERHLGEMREWYRRKLRELSQLPPESAAAAAAEPDVAADAGTAETARNILSLTGAVEPGDRQLGELLRALELVDAETLSALLVEARRQRRSLRQMLLAGNYLTLYQLALIEAGNLDALVLGPTRVVDRVRLTAREAVYRVFDPRRGRELCLRWLAESEAQDAIRPDEFRQRFSAAATVQHPHLAVSLEVLDIAGRPAVLQEWLSGLPSTDWPSLASVPGVWYRLLCQTALGLHTIHQAGLVHGHLDADSILLTMDGLVKVCGFGEPAWLVEPPEASESGQPSEPADESAAHDLAALGRLAAAWVAPRPGKKPKALPEALQTVLRGLNAEDQAERFGSAKVLLEALDHAGAGVPPNAEAWDRLLRHVRDTLSHSQTELRRSA